MNWPAILILATISYLIWYDRTLRHPDKPAFRAMLTISLGVYVVYLCGLAVTSLLGLSLPL